ncbi:hypothetical protein ACFCXS_29055 [Streptomyces sp. NPDC056373]|uniref:hypothetical protein n=1 Tax=Streptomyces sp. NPDC056373 TaxID=3345798 RepID=UPI0035DF5C17
MRSARMLLATATATAALAIAAPAAYAEATGDWDHDTSSSYSKEHHKDGNHDGPRGGMHTGGGALSAVSADDWDGSRHDEDSDAAKRDEGGKHEEHGKENGHEKGDWEGKHDGHGKPHGGVHTGGGALSAVNSDDWGNPKHDPDTYKDEDDWGDRQEEDGYGDKGDWGAKEEKGDWGDKEEKGSWEGKHDKPRGGMHTGGGGLASAPGVTAGGLAALAVAGTGMYALRRRKTAQGAV